MSAHDYKKIVKKHPAAVVQYHPAEAVRKRGDDWLNGRECWNVSVETCVALRHNGPDFSDYVSMCNMERGERSRV